MAKLNYDDIKDSCKNLTTLAGKMDDTTTASESAISKIESPAWEGKASSAFRDAITKLIDNLPDAKQQMALSVVFLASCADAYEQIDNESLKKLKELIGGQDYIDKYNVDSAPDVDLNARYGGTVTDKGPEESAEWQQLASNSSSNSGIQC